MSLTVPFLAEMEVLVCRPSGETTVTPSNVSLLFACSYGFLDASYLHQGLFVLLASFVLLSDRDLIKDFDLSEPLPLSCPDDKVRRHLVYLKYWTLNPNLLLVYPKVLLPPRFIIKALLPCALPLYNSAFCTALTLS